MTVEELLGKLNKLDSIYLIIDTEIEAYDCYIKKSICDNWGIRKEKIKVSLINKFKEKIIKDCEDESLKQILAIYDGH